MPQMLGPGRTSRSPEKIKRCAASINQSVGAPRELFASLASIDCVLTPTALFSPPVVRGLIGFDRIKRRAPRGNPLLGFIASSSHSPADDDMMMAPP